MYAFGCQWIFQRAWCTYVEGRAVEFSQGYTVLLKRFILGELLAAFGNAAILMFDAWFVL